MTGPRGSRPRSRGAYHRMLKTVEVLDDFHPDPAEVRELALASDWRAAVSTDCLWLGSRLALCVPDKNITERLRRLLGPRSERIWGGITQALFVVACEGSLDPGVTRLEDGEWAAVVWLCRPEQCRGGISFYRPANPPACMNGDVRAGPWEETMFIPARFNRMVLISSTAFFRPATGFGEDPGSGPLTQVILANTLPTERRGRTPCTVD